MLDKIDSQQWDFRQGAAKESNRSVYSIHEDCEPSGNTAENSSAKSIAHGFSLFELLIALSIMGILASIAYPIYTHAIIKTHRAEAKVALINLANRMESYYLENNNSYVDASLSKLGINEKTDKNLYHLSLSSTHNSYKLVATATFTDPECRRFLLNELGEKTSAGNSPSCW